MDIETQKIGDEGGEAASIFNKANTPITLKFVDVVYKVKIPSAKSFIICGNGSKGEEKVILKGVSGLVQAGEMLAMLGPSGSGKTTLLTALGGKLGGRLAGSITYNGNPFSNSLNRKTGFVTQDDVLYPHLTVMETLIFTALLRLPNSLTNEVKAEQAKAVITQLDLTRCKDSIIGSEWLRGVSGGERKRVSIGQEMLINPSLLFLDEPTSGLDSTTALRIVSTLWELAKGGRTVVMTIHQPSSRLFYMFDKVMLLSEGNPIYFGEGATAMDYFSSVGYAPTLLMNPADFLLDLANGISTDNESRESAAVIKQNLVDAYKTNIDEKLKEDISRIGDYPQEKSHDKGHARWPTTWWQQFTVLSRRGIKERKYESFSGLKIAQVLVIAFIAGLLWWQSTNLQDQIGMFFFFSGFWGFFPLFEAIFTFPQEHRMLEKERSAGMYRLSSFFMSRLVIDMPMELVLPTLSTIIIYFMSGFKRTAGHFFFTLAVLLYNVLVAQGLGLALGALIMDQRKATVLASVIMLSFTLAGGYFVQHVPAFIAWIKYISISQYVYKLMIRSQFKPGDTYPCGNDGKTVCDIADYPPIKLVGFDGQAVACVALAVMLVGYRLIAYVALMRVGVTKK